MIKIFFSLERDLIFVAVYLSPEGSTVFSTYEKAGFEYIEEKINQIVEENENIDIMLAGDFNARTGELDDFIMTDSTEFVPELCDNPSYDTNDFNMPRENVDKEINNYGRDLISFGQSYDIHIVNGRVTGDERGNITCVANGGRSVVDYILVNTRFYNRVSHLEVCVRTESDHFPLLCQLGCAFQNNHVSLDKEAKKAKENLKSSNYKWSSEGYEKFSRKLNDRHTENKLDEISNLLSGEVNRNKVNLVASYFQTLFSYLCSDMKRVQYKESKSVKPRWYDSECRTIKRDKFKFLNLFVKTGYQYFYEKFRTLRNKFKHTVRAKTKEDKDSLRKQIENSVNDQKLFWGLIKKLS